MNDSILAISPAWPTRWPKGSFKSPWTWVIAAVITVPLIVLFSFSVGHPILSSLNAQTIDAGIAAQFVIDGLLILLVVSTLPFLSRFSLRELGFRVPSLSVIGTAALGTVAMIVVANGSAVLIDRFSHVQHVQQDVEMFKQLHDPASIAMFAAFAVLFAPFAEETCFRIFFFNLGMRYGGFWLGAIVSGALFGIAHGDPYAAVPLAFGGVVLCAVYYRTRNAYAPMITHALFNGFSIVALLVAPSLT